MKTSFILHNDYFEMIDMLTDEQAGQLFKAIFQYEITGAEPSLDDVTKMAFTFIRAQLDRDAEKYEEVCEKRKEAGRMGGLAKASKSKQVLAKAGKAKQTLANLADNDNDNVNDNENVNVNDNDNNITPIPKRFTPPTVPDVQNYCHEKGYSIDANAFVDFYSSKGWMVGKNKMKDWRAAVRNWARSDRRQKKDVYDEWRNA